MREKWIALLCVGIRRPAGQPWLSCASSELYESFLREARLTALLEHPNINGSGIIRKRGVY